MKLPAVVVVAALLPPLAWLLPAGAQAPRPAPAMSLPQAERNAVELKQGMSLDEVQKLLGKPRRTALKNTGSAAGQPWQGTLHWTYNWGSASASEGHLQVVFAAKEPEKWFVDSWQWGSY
jgi:hypothetical protein